MRLLLDSNRSKLEVRILIVVPQGVLKSNVGAEYLKLVDHFEVFHSNIRLNRFIRVTFSSKFLTKEIAHKCQKMLNTTLTATGSNLRVLQLIVDNAARDYSYLLQWGSKNIQPLSCLEKSCKHLAAVLRY